MRRIVRSLLAVAWGVPLGLSGSGTVDDTASNAYEAIVQRNAFALKPIPPPAIEPVKPQPPVNIKFSGIDTFRSKKAYFVLPNPEKQGTFLYPCIKEGDQAEGIEVLKIDEKEGAVDIRNHGTPMRLTFAANGNLPSPVSLPGAAPGSPPIMPVMSPPMTPGSPNLTFPVRTIPPPPGIIRNSPVVTPGLGSPIPMSTPSSSPIPAPVPTQLPTRPTRTSGGPPDQVGLVTSMLNMEVQRELNKEAIAAGQFPPLPPTELTETPPASSTTGFKRP